MLTIKQLTSPHSFAANTYLITSCDECAVIDPAAPYDPSFISGRVKYIFLTHAHFDHILEIDSWVNATGAQVVIAKGDAPALSDSNLNCYALFASVNRGYSGDATVAVSGDSFLLGEDTISVIESPGHTAGSCVYLSGIFAFVGDTLFAGGGFGRWDLPTGNYAQLRESIDKLLELPDVTVIYCGHGESTTIKEYKEVYKKQRKI